MVESLDKVSQFAAPDSKSRWLIFVVDLGSTRGMGILRFGNTFPAMDYLDSEYFSVNKTLLP